MKTNGRAKEWVEDYCDPSRSQKNCETTSKKEKKRQNAMKLQQYCSGQATLVASPDQAAEHHMQEAGPQGLMGNKSRMGTQTLLCCSGVSLFREECQGDASLDEHQCFPNTPDATS